MTCAEILAHLCRGDFEALVNYTGLRDPGLSRRQKRELADVISASLRMARVQERAKEILDRRSK